MTTTQNDQQGEFRCLTEIEIARAVKNARELLGLKQISLAHRAGVTERTIQRIENGHSVSEDTYRNVALALGYAPAAFVGPRLVKSPDEAANMILGWLERFQIATLLEVVDWRVFDQLMQVQAFIIDDSRLTGDSVNLVPVLRDYLHECIDFADLMSGIERMEHANNMLAQLRSIEALGVCSKYVVAESTDNLKVGMILLFPSGDEMRNTPSIILPKSFVEFVSGSAVEECEKFADLFDHILERVNEASQKAC